MTSFSERVRAQTGRRGAILLCLAVFDFINGYGIMVAPTKSVPVHFLYASVWGWVWMAAAVVIATGVFIHKDSIHFALSASLKFAYGAFWILVWLESQVPFGWIKAAVWLAFAAIIYVIARWPEYRAPSVSTNRPGR